MVDFRKLRASRSQPDPIDPLDIFRRLPKSPGINDLYASQAQVLEEWFRRRNEQDLAIELHTGGGKTLVGLLIAQSIMNETREPVLYLSPTRQLVTQTLDKAQEYNIAALPYEREQDFPDAFLSGKGVLICTYQALFNGLSRFGVRGRNRIMQVAGLILDDAHVAFANTREAFTLRLKKADHTDEYADLTSLFRPAFHEIGRVGTFDDVVSGQDLSTVLEVPYWSWKNNISAVQQRLRALTDEYRFVWPLLRDALEYCHCLICRDALVLTPILPLVDMFPTFADCPRRVFMSATISDETAIIRTFDAQVNSMAKPIVSRSLAGVSERMILAPELMKISLDAISDVVHSLAQHIADDPSHGAGTVILVPSRVAAQRWNGVATTPETSSAVAVAVASLQDGTSRGPVVLANRYDGIDLPGSACRLLILDGLPKGISEYDRYRASTFGRSAELDATLAQRIEQGIGRAARGAGDYCVVLLTGNDLTAWLGRTSNRRFLTTATRVQLELGLEISRDVATQELLIDTIMRCLSRDQDWIAYHADILADRVEPTQEDDSRLRHAEIERSAFRLLRQGYHEKALGKLEALCEQSSDLDAASRGWLLQLAARVASFWGNDNRAQELQRRAYAFNQNLLRPRAASVYVPLQKPSPQANSLVGRIAGYAPRKAYLVAFEEAVAHLVPDSSAAQFEQGLADLGEFLGFQAQRPDHIYGKGPDVLWLVDDRRALIMEAKSRKDPTNPLTKEEHGQLLNAAEWFKHAYPEYEGIRVSVHPNEAASASTVTGDSKVLTLVRLNDLVAEARALVRQLCDSPVPEGELVLRCEHLLGQSHLTPDDLINHYLAPFKAD